MKKIKLVLSDVHMGKGRVLLDGRINILEDLPDDSYLIEFLEHYSHGDYYKADVELIFNGDFLNTIQVDYRGHFPTAITERVSVEKIKSVIEGHRGLFAKFSEFANAPHHSITIVVGNHDVDLLWSEAKKVLQGAMGGEGRVRIFDFVYKVDGIHVEHGNQYEAINRMEPNLLFLTKDLPEPVLNLPWATLFCIRCLTKFKQERPYVDKVHPFRRVLWWSFWNDFPFFFRAVMTMILYFFRTRFSKSKYRHSRFRTTLSILKQITVNAPLDHFAKEILEKHSSIHTVIFGHSHGATHRRFATRGEYFNTGTWNDVVHLDLENLGRSQRCTFAYIEYPKSEGRPVTVLKEWRGTWKAEVPYSF